MRTLVSPEPSDLRPIYFDYHATTPVDPRVAEVVLRFLTEDFGNAHSRDHVFGDIAAQAVEAARGEVAQLVDSSPRDVIFTSGATEALNIALVSASRPRLSSKRVPRLAVTAAEHSAVLDTALALAKAGAVTLKILPVDRYGHVELDALTTSCRAGLDAVAIIAASNEVGTITNLPVAAGIVHEYGALLISDGTQAVGKIDVRVGRDAVDVLAFSGHKIYGPKGVGALIARPGVPLLPLVHGGGHERGLRSGTLNVAGIAGLGEAARLRRLEMARDEPAIAILRDRLQSLLRRSAPDLEVNGKEDARLAGNLHVAFPGIPNQAVIARIRNRLAISTGSACSSGIEGASHVLRAMGLSHDIANGALRFGLGKFVSALDVEVAGQLVHDAVNQVRDAL